MTTDKQRDERWNIIADAQRHFGDAFRHEVIDAHGPGRYEHIEEADLELAVALDLLMTEGFDDESGGSVDAYGWAGRIGRFLLCVDSQGFVSLDICNAPAIASERLDEYIKFT